MKLSMRDQVIVGVALLVAISAALIFLLVVPKFQEVSRIDGEIVAADQEIAAAEVLLAKRMAAKENAAKTSADLLLLGNRMPESPELPALIIALQDVADVSGMQLLRVSPASDEGEGGDGFGTYDVDLLVRGRWVDYVDFLRRLQVMARGLRITEISVQYEEPVTQGEDGFESPVFADTIISATMSVRVYTYVPAPAADATGAAPPVAPAP